MKAVAAFTQKNVSVS